MSGARLPKNKSMSIHRLNTYLKPEKVYIPNINVRNCEFSINDKVLKGDVLGYIKKIPIYSSVSGVIVDFVTINEVPCVVIKNDFKEKNKFKKRDISNLTKEDFIDILKENNIVGMGGAGFPTYIKYDNDNIKTLIVNAVECEPYITSDYTLFMKYTKEILDTIKDIKRIMNIKKVIIAVKKYNKDLVDRINKYIDSYEGIKLSLVKDIYPAGWERRLIKEVCHKTYKDLPIERGIVVNNVSTIYQIGLSLYDGIPLIERIVTFTGEGLKKPCNVLVKVGTKVNEVIESIGVHKNSVVIENGPMMGKIASDDLIVTPTLNCVLVLKNSHGERLNECLRCGKCASVCPCGLMPVLIKDNINTVEILKKLHPEKCVSCGLCSYICPSKIDVRQIVNDAKEKVK